MGTKTETSTPFSRLSRMGLGIGFKSQSASPRPRNRNSEKLDDDEWYIPYNGPYEAPKDPFRPQKQRDSWGDPLSDGDDADDVLGDKELHKRYGGQRGGEYGAWNVDGNEGNERKGRPRARTQSGVSGRTVSSGNVDPSRVSLVGRRSTVSNGTGRPAIPSYINLDAAGGVGASPVPPLRTPKEQSISKRTSLASLFSFGASSRKPERSHTNPPTPSRSTNFSLPKHGSERPSSPSGPASPRSQLEWQTRNTPKRGRRDQPFPSEHNGIRTSTVAEDEDYYNSYYSTLIQSPLRNNYLPEISTVDSADPFHRTENQAPRPPPKDPISPVSDRPHPYAYDFPIVETPRTPQSAPIMSASQSNSPHYHYPQPPRLTFTQASQAPSSANTPHFNLPLPAGSSHLKGSISTPDLRNAAAPSLKRGKSGLPKGKERWLSPETWCDALLFPRPRFRIKEDGEVMYGATQRIVSPPGSPIFADFARRPPTEGVVSRVLAHSRSLVDLSSPDGSGSNQAPGSQSRGPPPSEAGPSFVLNGNPNPSRPPRPKSFALDDLALPSPVPSLARVLEDGQILEHQRKKWQMQATGSFQNARTRSLSRARAKSLTGKQVKRSDNPAVKHPHMDFLAARSLLGNQNVIPVSTHARTNSQTDSRGTHSRISHSHSNSLAKTISKSSKAHSRNDSWSTSALKITKAMCGIDGRGIDLTPTEEKGREGLEGALQGNGTRVIRLADPAQIPVDKGYTPISSRNGASPTPSGVSDVRLGIALSTPPPFADDNTLDRESIRLPAHPYAQGGLTFYNSPNVPEPRDRGSDYAGPHPSLRIVGPDADTQDVSSRHRLPPQASLHPYAQISARDSYQSDAKLIQRADSNVPPPNKMWAQFSPGFVREILPNEIQYSPYESERGSPVGAYSPTPRAIRDSDQFLDIVGVGEALVSAMNRRSKDSGVGTSEEYTVNQMTAIDADSPVEGSFGGSLNMKSAPQRIHRKPVQYSYDASRPTHHQPPPQRPPILSEHHHTLETIQSVETRLSPFSSSPGPGHSSGSSPGKTSESSSPQHSPRPLGNADDLDQFDDLFYRPDLNRNYSSDMSLFTLAKNPPLPWDVSPSGRRTGSGLTSLAHQLSQEFEEINAEHGRTISMDTDAFSNLRPSIVSSPSVAGISNLHFVISNNPESTSLVEAARDVPTEVDETILPFEPSVRIPEDVESSRASSLMEESTQIVGDETEMFRMGFVESMATPPAVSGDHRTSYMGQMAFVSAGEQLQPDDDEDQTVTIPRQSITAPHFLQPSADPTRSSYMTTSDTSRMSGLSDFPVPPLHDNITPAHMSLLTSYFEEESHESDVPRAQIITSSQRLTYGDEEIEHLISNLSSHSS